MFRDTIVVALGTAFSRLTGLLRVMVFGVVIGQTALADAYDGANNSPNSIYELLVGGVLAASLVPLFSRLAEDGDDEGTNAVASVTLIVVGAATAIAVLAAPLIFRLYSLSPSAPDVDEFRRAGTAMTRIFLVQIFFYGVITIGSALLNSRRRFFAAAWAPVLANVFIILTLMIIPFTRDGAPQLADIFDSPLLFWLITLGATGGIALQAWVLLPALRNAGIHLRFRPNFRHPAVRTMARLSMWTFGYVVTNQVTLVVIKNLARPGSGDLDAYSKAYTFFLLPHGLLAISIATTFVPELARMVANRDTRGFAGGMTAGMRWITLLTTPASFGMVVLAQPIIVGLLRYGNFGPEAAANTGRALAGFSVGLLGFSLYIFALRGFYAHHDTRTPFIVNLLENVLNVVLAVVLVDRHGVLGLGLAFGIAYLISAVVAVVLLWKMHSAVIWPSFLSVLVRATIAGAACGATVWVVENVLEATSSITQLAETIICLVIGSVVYVVGLWLMRVPELKRIGSLLPGRAPAG
jgi:putative peptidoglycan lipid II flippase